jgi:glycosyltransferase involved in cell wall biosynthesis
VKSCHFVVPDGLDDPMRPTGGNRYDRRLSDELTAAGWQVREHVVPGGWPAPDAGALDTLTQTLSSIPDSGVVLVDGLIGSAAPQVLTAESARLRLVLLVHMPLGETGDAARASEAAALRAATAVVATSSWTRDLLLDRYRLSADRLYVANPGVERAELAAGTSHGGQLLCVAAVAAHKGHDVLLDALASVADLNWHCRCIGPLDRDPGFVARLQAQVVARGLDGRVEFAGPRTGAALDRGYASADLVVSASHGETYGMALAEALARGLPVLATEVGGVREPLGQGSAAGLPGLLVPPADPVALAGALRRWLTEPTLRAELRAAAAVRRLELPTWTSAAAQVADALVAATRTAG